VRPRNKITPRNRRPAGSCSGRCCGGARAAPPEAALGGRHRGPPGARKGYLQGGGAAPAANGRWHSRRRSGLEAAATSTQSHSHRPAPHPLSNGESSDLPLLQTLALIDSPASAAANRASHLQTRGQRLAAAAGTRSAGCVAPATGARAASLPAPGGLFSVRERVRWGSMVA